MSKRPYILSLLLFTAVTLAACDAPADDSAAGGEGSDLPAATSRSGNEAPAVESEEVSGSTDPASPGGEAVTEQEIPHSDVPPPSRAVFTDAACDFESWVGQKVDEAAVKKTGRPYRLLEPDSMMTMDHSPDRINVVHDKDMIVTRVWCG